MYFTELMELANVFVVHHSHEAKDLNQMQLMELLDYIHQNGHIIRNQ